MPWRNTPSGRYYYRFTKENGRTKAIYFGNGEAAVQAAHEDVVRTTRKLAALQQATNLHASWQELQWSIQDLRKYIRGLMHAVQWNRGWFCRKREWRRRRGHRNKN